jgi:hypothetical protein
MSLLLQIVCSLGERIKHRIVFFFSDLRHYVRRLEKSTTLTNSLVAHSRLRSSAVRCFAAQRLQQIRSAHVTVSCFLLLDWFLELPCFLLLAHLPLHSLVFFQTYFSFSFHSFCWGQWSGGECFICVPFKWYWFVFIFDLIRIFFRFPQD